MHVTSVVVIHTRRRFHSVFKNVNDYPASAALPANERGYTLFDYADPTNATPDKGYIKYNYAKGMRVFKKGDINS